MWCGVWCASKIHLNQIKNVLDQHIKDDMHNLFKEMPKFIQRFFAIRSVIKDVYMQIDELNVFNHERSRSLGRHPPETICEWRYRSKDPYTHTWDYEREDYMKEVSDIDKMNFEINHVLCHTGNIYSDLLSILKCNRPRDYNEDLRIPDDPSEDLFDVLNPKVDQFTEWAMSHDNRLRLIIERIYNVIYNVGEENACLQFYHLDHTYEMFLILRDNRLSNTERTDAEQKALEEWSLNYRMPYSSKD